MAKASNRATYKRSSSISHASARGARSGISPVGDSMIGNNSIDWEGDVNDSNMARYADAMYNSGQ